MAGSNEIKLGVVAGDIKATSALSPGSAGIANEGTKGGGQGLKQLGRGVEGADGLPELGADVADHDRLADLDFDIEDLACHEKLLALLGNGETVFAREGVRLDANPDDDRGNRLSDETDASNVCACPLHPLGLEDVVDLKSKVVLPDCLQGVVADSPKLLALEVCLRASGPLPSIGARASHKDWLGVQPVIVVLGLHIGDREAKRSGGALRRG